MSNKRIPKSALFGWLTQPRPRCGPKKRWRDAVRQDLKTISVGENNWYSEANESREVWRALYKLGVEDHVKSRCTDRQSTQANYGVPYAKGLLDVRVIRRGTNIQPSGKKQ